MRRPNLVKERNTRTEPRDTLHGLRFTHDVSRERRCRTFSTSAMDIVEEIRYVMVLKAGTLGF